MATAVNASIGVGGSATGLTSGSVSPSGSDRYMFGVACGLSADPTAFKYGGSGGTDLTQIGSDTSFGVFYTANFWDIAPGPTGSTTAYAAYSASGSNALTAIFSTGVDQTTPAEAIQTASGDNGGFSATTVATITVTGVESGQLVEAGLAFGMLGEASLVSIVAGDNTTVERTDAGTVAGERQAATAMLSGTASGTTITLSATITVSATFSTFFWLLGARPLNAASGGGTEHPSTGALTADAATVAGTATRFRAHPSTGALTAQSATMAGTATHLNQHPSTGALTAQSATVSGTATRFRAHPSTGVLTAQAATVAGTATRFRAHPATGALTAQSATMAGDATVTPAAGPHATTGALVAQAATVAGNASVISLNVPNTGGGGGRKKPRFRITPVQLPVQPEEIELPGEEDEYITPAVEIVDTYAAEFDKSRTAISDGIASMSAELAKREAELKRQIEDAENILLYL